MPKPLTPRFVTRTLLRLKRVTKIEPNGPANPCLRPRSKPLGPAFGA
jgi:hypothetical protein